LGFLSPQKLPVVTYSVTNSLKHLATLVLGVMLDIMQQISSGLPSWFSSILGRPL